MKNKIFQIIIWAVTSVLTVTAQDIRHDVLNPVTHSAGSSMAYEYIPQEYTPAPEGYEPFYINHLGRHGSRNHTSENLYTSIASALKEGAKAGTLTERGAELLGLVEEIVTFTDRRYGDLSNVGAGEHRQIAERMYSHYPEVFTGGNSGRRIDAKSTLVPRCVLSMANFCLALRECGVTADISMESSDRNNAFMNYYSSEYRDYYDNGPWKEIYRQYYDANVDPARLMSSLFTEVPSKVSDPKRFMTNLFSGTTILQGTDLDISLYDFFTEDEIFTLWKVQNLNQYLRKGPSAVGGGTALSIAKPMLRDFLRTAQEAVDGGTYAAHLRFAHGENIMPFTALTRIEGAYAVESDPAKVYLAWNDFRITPMGSNVQWIFYRNGNGEVLVKVLMNEREARIPVETGQWPYYEWDKVRSFYGGILAE